MVVATAPQTEIILKMTSKLGSFFVCDLFFISESLQADNVINKLTIFQEDEIGILLITW